MKIVSSAILGGKIDLKYGKYGNDFVDDMPSLSLPFSIIDFPDNTQSFALILDDKEAQEVAGFTWIHWLAANIMSPGLPEGASCGKGLTHLGRTMDTLYTKGQESLMCVEGKNSWGVCCYGGMAPPNKPHRYDLTVFALDSVLSLTNGFLLDELKAKMKGHILDQAVMSGIYPN